MVRAPLLLMVVACAAAFAGEAAPRPGEAKPAPAEPAPARVRYHLWKAPFYPVLGLPRDLLDAPSKALSSIPIFNRVFIAPLAILNALTTTLCWSLTREGIDGGFEAWIDCLDLPRSKKAKGPDPLRGRPWWKNYVPNLRSWGIVTREPKAQ